MGTRNLTMVFHEGQYKLAQYGQWDGYPSGQGFTVLEFARDKMDRDKFIAGLNRCREPSKEEVKQRYVDLGGDGSGWVSMDVAAKFKRHWPALDRDMGAKVLELIQNSEHSVEIHRDISFAADSLFCEWAYVIDLDNHRLEAFKGFNHQPLDPSERFASVPLPKDRNPEYYQIKLAKSWPLDALPTDEQFEAELTPDEDEEEAA